MPVIMVFRCYVRIAPRLPSPGIVGQAPLSGPARHCGGGHGTVTTPACVRVCEAGRGVSAVQGAPGGAGGAGEGAVGARREGVAACEAVNVSTSRSAVQLMCEKKPYTKVLTICATLRGGPCI